MEHLKESLELFKELQTKISESKPLDACIAYHQLRDALHENMWDYVYENNLIISYDPQVKTYSFGATPEDRVNLDGLLSLEFILPNAEFPTGYIYSMFVSEPADIGREEYGYVPASTEELWGYWNEIQDNGLQVFIEKNALKIRCNNYT